MTKKDDEELPFATVVTANGRQLVATVNPAAAAKGIASGTPLADALSFLPGLLTRAAEPAEDVAALRRLTEWCGRYSPWTAPDGEDGIKIEITGSAHLWGGEAELAADLSRRLARQAIAHRLAIADTLGAAWAMARLADDDAAPAIVAPEKTRDALAPLPVAALRLDPVLVQGLYRVGLRRVGEVMAMPRDALARRFGEAVARRLDQALGDLPEPLSPLGETPARRVRLSFAEPIAEPADLCRAIERLARDLVPRLAREGLGARRLQLGFHRVDGRVERIAIGTARPTRDPAHLAALLKARLDTVDPGFGIEDAILAAFAVEKLPAEQIEAPLPARRNPRPDPPAGESGRDAAGGDLTARANLAPLFDRLGARLGLAAVARLEARASHIPERASVAIALGEGDKPPRPPRGEEDRTRGTSGPIEAPQKPPRPVRLFAPPEPVDAFWVLPDDPPFRFVWRRRPHRVVVADGPERIAEEWWRANGPAAAAWSPDAIRDYYRVEDETGRRFWLFRAGLPGDPPPRWFVHGVFA
ncbi:MAG TPA: DNA polymerase Y family protein [Stellaceae bacterium]|nr:DNA polymerase Y family protein [Stellaceae bacterium]